MPTGDKTKIDRRSTFSERWRQATARSQEIAHVRKNIVELRDTARAIAVHCERVARTLETLRDIHDADDALLDDALLMGKAADALELPDELPDDEQEVTQ